MFLINEPICIGFPALIKAHVTKDGRRAIELECSNEEEDAEGDRIMQEALLNSAESFLNTGHIDIDHYSELGKNPQFSYLGIRDPNEWIIGLPLEVKNLGGGRTGLKAEIFRNKDGAVDTHKYKYDMFWQTLQTDPPARWYASVYGYPGDDTEKAVGGASRYLIKSFDWKSTAVTRTPVNTSIRTTAKIVSAKAFAAHLPQGHVQNHKYINNALLLSKSSIPFTRDSIIKSFKEHICKSCPSTENGETVNTWTIRDHYIKCEYLPYNLADLCALATSELMNR